jgi:hypothetical protein
MRAPSWRSSCGRSARACASSSAVRGGGERPRQHTSHHHVAAGLCARCGDTPSQSPVLACTRGAPKNTHTHSLRHPPPDRPACALTITTPGTPVQNNLAELHSLLEFAVGPALLGGARDFKANYERPINAGQDRCACWSGCMCERGASKGAVSSCGRRQA